MDKQILSLATLTNWIQNASENFARLEFKVASLDVKINKKIWGYLSASGKLCGAVGELKNQLCGYATIGDYCQGLTWTVAIHGASVVLEETKVEQAYQQIQFCTESEWHVMGEVATWLFLSFMFKFKNDAVFSLVMWISYTAE
jgi:hypothetical protein